MWSTKILKTHRVLITIAFGFLSALPSGTSITGTYHITGTYTGVYAIQIAFNAGFLQNVHMQPTGTDQGTWYYDWTPTGYFGNVEIWCAGSTRTRVIGIGRLT